MLVCSLCENILASAITFNGCGPGQSPKHTLENTTHLWSVLDPGRKGAGKPGRRGLREKGEIAEKYQSKCLVARRPSSA